MLSHLLTRECTIVRRTPSGDTDDYGNDIPAETTTVTVCELQQTQRTEGADAGETSATTWLLILPANTLLDTSDSVSVSGHEYELVGDPWTARNPETGVDHHLEATVQRVAGAEDTGS